METPWAADYVDLSSKFLSDDEAEHLYARHPDLPRNTDNDCPTCSGDRRYKWRDRDMVCDCAHQLTLAKHYLAAGIGDLYQRLDWDDYEGDDTALRYAVQYLANYREMVRAGIGLMYLGGFGVGKTMLINQVGKELVKLGYDYFFVTFSAMIQMYTAGWVSNEDRARFERRVVGCRVLGLDDPAKEFKTKTNLTESTFDHVLRQRVINSRPTFIATNLSEDEFSQGYGGAIFSLLKERSVICESKGDDWRSRARTRSIQEAQKRERRPIT